MFSCGENEKDNENTEKNNIGCVSGDCENGYGTYIFSNGDKYVEDKDNKMRLGSMNEGLLSMKYFILISNGDKYVGEWKDNKMHGIGTYTWGEGDSEGHKYFGEWKDGKRNGYGTYTMADGTAYKYLWKNGRQLPIENDNEGEDDVSTDN